MRVPVGHPHCFVGAAISTFLSYTISETVRLAKAEFMARDWQGRRQNRSRILSCAIKLPDSGIFLRRCAELFSVSDSERVIPCNRLSNMRLAFRLVRNMLTGNRAPCFVQITIQWDRACAPAPCDSLASQRFQTPCGHHMELAPFDRRSRSQNCAIASRVNRPSEFSPGTNRRVVPIDYRADRKIRSQL